MREWISKLVGLCYKNKYIYHTNHFSLNQPNMDHINLRKNKAAWNVHSPSHSNPIFDVFLKVKHKWKSDNKYFSPIQKLFSVIVFGEVVNAIGRLLGIHLSMEQAFYTIYSGLKETLVSLLYLDDDDSDNLTHKRMIYILHSKDSMIKLDTIHFKNLQGKIVEANQPVNL